MALVGRGTKRLGAGVTRQRIPSTLDPLMIHDHINATQTVKFEGQHPKRTTTSYVIILITYMYMELCLVWRFDEVP